MSETERETEKMESEKDRYAWGKEKAEKQRPVGPTNTKWTFNNSVAHRILPLLLKVQNNPAFYCRYAFWQAMLP